MIALLLIGGVEYKRLTIKEPYEVLFTCEPPELSLSGIRQTDIAEGPWFRRDRWLCDGVIDNTAFYVPAETAPRR